MKLWYWMKEREEIRKKRDAGLPKPWTEDEILMDYRFCNVYREYDTVTVWIRENIREPYATHPYLWHMLAIARYINWPETLDELMKEGAFPIKPNFTPEHMTEVLERRKARGDKVFTGAYLIRAESDPKKTWYEWSKSRYVSEIVLGRLWEQRERLSVALQIAKTLEDAQALFERNPYFVGWGAFMSYELITDLRHTRYLDSATDIYSWANPSPGARRGLNRIHDRPLNKNVPLKQAIAEMRELLNHNKLGWNLEMRDIEHSLCEMDKYMRLEEGGKVRAKYNGRS